MKYKAANTTTYKHTHKIVFTLPLSKQAPSVNSCKMYIQITESQKQKAVAQATRQPTIKQPTRGTTAGRLKRSWLHRGTNTRHAYTPLPANHNVCVLQHYQHSMYIYILCILCTQILSISPHSLCISIQKPNITHIIQEATTPAVHNQTLLQAPALE